MLQIKIQTQESHSADRSHLGRRIEGRISAIAIGIAFVQVAATIEGQFDSGGSPDAGLRGECALLDIGLLFLGRTADRVVNSVQYRR